ncbi:MAG: iron complex outermembrane receptor protein [Porticoccaceae bacterium]|jgi:iron complex outermembrane receptor protein
MSKKFALLVGFLSSCLSFNSYAQLEEIVVTAQKRAQSANDIGITVNAFTGQELKDLGVFSAEDLAIYTPGLTVNDTAATGVPLYTIRGVGFQDYSTAASSTVGLYFDEVSIPYSVMSRGLVFDVGRVEVLKGPQGDLYGRNTTAGQINFVSNKPTEDFEAGVGLGYASYQTVNIEGFISGAISANTNARLAVKTTQSGEGWQKSLTRDDELGEKDAKAFRALFDINLSEDTSLLLNFHYVDDQSDNRANTAYDGRIVGNNEFSSPYTALADYILPTGSNFGETPPWYSTGNNEAADWTNSYTSPITGRTFDLRPKRDNQLAGFSAKLEWDLGNMLLSSITGYDQFDRVESNDWDGGFYNDSSNINTTDLSVFSQELRLSGESENLNWIAGLYYSKDEMEEYYHYFMSDSVFGLGSIPFNVAPFRFASILELDTIYAQETDSIAAFGHVEWQLSEKTRLTVGARYTEENRDFQGCTRSADDGSLAGFLNFAFGASLSPGDCGTIDDDPDSPNNFFALAGSPNINNAFPLYQETISTEKWSGKIGLDYAISDDLLIYSTLSQGFKSGGFNGANSNTTRQLNSYKPEELTSLEFGAKSTLLDGRMQLNLSAFLYDYKDKQEQDRAVTFVGNISGLTNVPKSTIKGAEIDLKWAVNDRLRLDFAVALLDTEIDEFMAVDGDLSSFPNIVLRDASGIELAQSPELSWSARADYSWPLASGLMMNVGADASYTGETSGGAQIEDATDSYTIANARVGISAEDDKWRATFWGRNISDEYYYPAAYTGGNGPYIRANGMPSTYGVTFDYNF